MVDKKHNKTSKPEEPEEKNNPQNGGQPGEGDIEAPMSIAISMEEFTSMQSGLEQAQKQATEYLDGWQRERAEFANFRRRTERDRQVERDSILASVVKKYLVVLDDLERALRTRPSSGEGAPWANGIELIARKLQGILESEGVTRIPAESELFDPTRHEAISQEPSADHKSGEVIEVIQQGYMIGDRVIRPALVRVAQ